MADGHLGKCKDCAKADAEETRRLKMQDPKWVIAEAERCRLKMERSRKAGKAMVITPEMKRDIMARYHEKYPLRKKANRMLSNALRDGKIKRKPCEVCGDIKSEGHHDDYSKLFDIRWLCKKHHTEHHVAVNDSRRMTASRP